MVCFGNKLTLDEECMTNWYNW